MKKKILFIADWPENFKNAAVLQALLGKNFSDEYEWTIWSCKKKVDSGTWYRWLCYFKGMFYVIRNRKKYDAIFIWQQMIAYILFEIRRLIPFKIPSVIFFTFIYNSNTIFRKYKKHMVGNALRYARAAIWPSSEMSDEVKKDFTEYSFKNYHIVTPVFDIIDDACEVDKRLDDPAFRNGVYAAGATERDFNIVIKAFKNTNVPVTIVCRNDYIITETDIPSNIRVLRFSEVPHDQYYALARQAFCIVLSALNEKSPGGGLLLNYAMLNSKPIIASESAGVKDVIINNKNGLLFRIGSSEKIYQAYEKLRKDEFFRKNLVKNAKETVAKTTPEYFIPKLIAIIENAAYLVITFFFPLEIII